MTGAAKNSSRDENHNYFETSNGLHEEEDEIELVVQGREIVVKERLLVKHSRYFNHVFGEIDPEAETVVLRHGLLYEEEEEEENNEEPLTMISFTTMKTIIDYFETGVLKIGELNVKQLLLASQLLLIGSVELECFNFLKSNLTLQNCVRHYVLADAKPSWSRLSRTHLARFIQHRFEQVMKLTQLYQLTDVEQFRYLIADECLCCEEHKVWEAVKEWVEYDEENRRQHLYSLMCEVQWVLVKEEKHLLEALSNPLLSGDEPCLELIVDALQYRRMDYAGKVDYWQGKKKPCRWPKLLAALSYADRAIECFDFEEQRWQLLTMKPGASFGAEMCYLKGRLFTLGGVQAKRVDRYRVEENVWAEEFPCLTQFRVAHGVVVSEDDIFVMGGSAKASADFGPGLDEMEKLAVVDNDNDNVGEWSMVSSMAIGRSYLASAVTEGKIYAVGGCLTERASTAEVYCMSSGTWSSIASTLSKRDSLGLAVLDGHLLAVGGFDNIENAYLNTVERYDPLRDTWQPVKPMAVPRRSPGVVTHKGKLYVIGGMGETEDLRSAEVYDPVADQWAKFPYPMKEICGWTACCLVEKPLRMMEIQEAAASAPMFNGRPVVSTEKGGKKRSVSNLNFVPIDSQKANFGGGGSSNGATKQRRELNRHN